MEHVSTNTMELVHTTFGIMRAVRETVVIYRNAVEFIGEVSEKHWDEIKDLSSKEQLSFIECLIHTTNKNEALYPEFDERFYKFPCYYRRSVINFVVGQLASYHTRLDAYNEERYKAISAGKRFRKKPPKLNLTTHVFPAMYKGNIFSFDINNNLVRLKVFIRNTWDWIELRIASQDLKHLRNSIAKGGTLASPTLVIRNNKLYLNFPIKWGHVAFPKKKVQDQRILAVDLGVNRGAVCSVMQSDGTIETRAFDPFVSERDRLDHMINRLKKVSAQSGNGQSLAAFYTKLAGIKKNYVRKLARWIVDLAEENGVYGIVFEYLGKMKPKWKKDKIHHWCKKKIIDLVKDMALRRGIRIFFVNPRNTSALAFDGSGFVNRDNNNYSLCTFPTGKRYHADLNASYNIGARYFIRAISKSMSETAWSECMAKVPALSRRTDCTLSTLKELSQIIADSNGGKRVSKSTPAATMADRSSKEQSLRSVRSLPEPVS